MALVTTLLLIPAFTLKVAEHFLAHGGLQASLLPPLWFAGMHDVMSGHIWAQVPRRTCRPESPSRSALLKRCTRAGVPCCTSSDWRARAASWSCCSARLPRTLNNRRLPDPPSPGTSNHGRATAVFDAIAGRLLARRPLVRAGFFFTVRVLARSAQNRLSIAIPLAIAVAVAVVSLPLAGLGKSLDFSSVPIALLAVQMLLVAALVMGFRHSVRVPADLRAPQVALPSRAAGLISPRSWRARKGPRSSSWSCRRRRYLLPLNVLAFGRHTALLHFAYGLLSACALERGGPAGGIAGCPLHPATFRRWTPRRTAAWHALASSWLALYTVAWLEHAALSTTRGTAVSLPSPRPRGQSSVPSTCGSGEIVSKSSSTSSSDPPTLRLGLME